MCVHSGLPTVCHNCLPLTCATLFRCRSTVTSEFALSISFLTSLRTRSRSLAVKGVGPHPFGTPTPMMDSPMTAICRLEKAQCSSKPWALRLYGADYLQVYGMALLEPHRHTSCRSSARPWPRAFLKASSLSATAVILSVSLRGLRPFCGTRYCFTAVHQIASICILELSSVSGESCGVST